MNICCRKEKCKFNKNYICTRSNLEINDNRECLNYEIVDKGLLQDSSKTMFEIAPKLAPYKDNKDIKISCKANCLFNKKGKCVCNGIIINNANLKKVDIFTKKDKNKIKTTNCNAVCFSFVKE
jgi:hypothetical protein